MPDDATPTVVTEPPANIITPPADNAPADNTPPATVINTVPPQEDMPEWMNDLPEAFKRDSGLSRYKDMDSFLQGHGELAKKVGEKFEAPIGDDKDAWNEWYDKTGRPKTAADYGEVEGLDMDAEALQTTKQAFHDIGLSDKQFKDVMEMYSKSETAQTEAQQAAAEQASIDQRKQTIATLKGEWGNDMDANMKIADGALHKLGLVESLGELGLLNDASAVKLGFQLAQITGETQLDADGTVQAGNFAEQVAALKAQPGYRNRSHPNHIAISTQLENLYKQQHQGAKARR